MFVRRGCVYDGVDGVRRGRVDDCVDGVRRGGVDDGVNRRGCLDDDFGVKTPSANNPLSELMLTDWDDVDGVDQRGVDDGVVVVR